jgi:hypothetical protein
VRVSARQIMMAGAFALAIANLGRIPAGVLAGRNAPVTLADLVTASVWFALVVALLTRQARVVWDDFLRTASGFVVIASISTAFALRRYGLGISDGFEVVAFLGRWILYLGWYPFVAWCLRDDESIDAQLYLDRALFAICVFGIVQAVFIPEFGTRIAELGLSPAWEYQGRRLVSTLLDPNFAGAMAVLALVRPLARVAGGERQPWWRLVVPAAAIILTASRSSVLATAVAFVVITYALGINRRLVRTVLTGALLLLPALPLVIAFGTQLNKFHVDSSAAQRLVTWLRAYTLFREHPWIGIGFNASKVAQEGRGWTLIGGADTGFDGGLLFVMVMTGVIGVAWYAAMLGRGIWTARRIWRDGTVALEDRAHATATAAGTVALVVHSLFSGSLLLPFVMQVMWIRFARLPHILQERRRAAWLAAAIPLVLATGACNPCSGMISCESAYELRVTGSIRNSVDGAPVPGVRIDVALRGSDGTRYRSTMTDHEGVWEISAPGDCCDDVHADFTVTPPKRAAYIVPTISVRGRNVHGDAVVLDPWLDRPSVRYGVLLIGPGGKPLAGASARFDRVDGVPITRLRSVKHADGSGIYHLDLASDRVGSVIGTLRVQDPTLSAPFRLDGMVVPIDYQYRLPTVVRINVAAGASAPGSSPALPPPSPPE